MVSEDTIRAWAENYGLPTCIGQLFVDEHGGRLPYDTTELCQWANSTGRRLPNGTWNCNPLPEGEMNQDWENFIASLAPVRRWVYNHPIEFVLIAVGGVWLLGSGRKRGR